MLHIEMERLLGWLPWLSLEMLKASFNIPSDDQGNHPNDLSISMYGIMDLF